MLIKYKLRGRVIVLNVNIKRVATTIVALQSAKATILAVS